MSTTTTEQLFAVDMPEPVYWVVREWALSEIAGVASSLQQAFREWDFKRIDDADAQLARIAAASQIVATPVTSTTVRVVGPHDLLAGGLMAAVEAATDTLPEDCSIPSRAADRIGLTIERMEDVRAALKSLSTAARVEAAP